MPFTTFGVFVLFCAWLLWFSTLLLWFTTLVLTGNITGFDFFCCCFQVSIQPASASFVTSFLTTSCNTFLHALHVSLALCSFCCIWEWICCWVTSSLDIFL